MVQSANDKVKDRRRRWKEKTRREEDDLNGNIQRSLQKLEEVHRDGQKDNDEFKRSCVFFFFL